MLHRIADGELDVKDVISGNFDVLPPCEFFLILDWEKKIVLRKFDFFSLSSSDKFLATDGDEDSDLQESGIPNTFSENGVDISGKNTVVLSGNFSQHVLFFKFLFCTDVTSLLGNISTPKK